VCAPFHFQVGSYSHDSMHMHANVRSAKILVLNDNGVKPTHLGGGCDFFATQ